jgi:hypothetical protein
MKTVCGRYPEHVMWSYIGIYVGFMPMAGETGVKLMPLELHCLHTPAHQYFALVHDGSPWPSPNKFPIILPNLLSDLFLQG